MVRKGPLRRIVAEERREEKTGDGFVSVHHFEVLECGHVQRPVADIYGETHAERRRCKGCAEGLPVEPPIGTRYIPERLQTKAVSRGNRQAEALESEGQA